MRRYVTLFGIAVVLSLLGLIAAAIIVAALAWMLHVVPETLGSLVKPGVVDNYVSARAVHAEAYESRPLEGGRP